MVVACTKRGALEACHWVGALKHAVFRTFHAQGGTNRGAAPDSYCLVWVAHMRATYCYEDSAYHYILGFCTTCGPVPDQCIIQPYFLLNIHCGGMIELYLK